MIASKPPSAPEFRWEILERKRMDVYWSLICASTFHMWFQRSQNKFPLPRCSDAKNGWVVTLLWSSLVQITVTPYNLAARPPWSAPPSSALCSIFHPINARVVSCRFCLRASRILTAAALKDSAPITSYHLFKIILCFLQCISSTVVHSLPGMQQAVLSAGTRKHSFHKCYTVKSTISTYQLLEFGVSLISMILWYIFTYTACLSFSWKIEFPQSQDFFGLAFKFILTLASWFGPRTYSSSRHIVRPWNISTEWISDYLSSTKPILDRQRLQTSI